MKVGVTCYPTYGGSGAVATELGISLAARGHEIHFISYAQPFRLSRFHERVYFHEVKMGAYPLFEHNHYALALAAAIHDAMQREGLDVVHVHYAVPHATSAWVAREIVGGDAAPPLVTTLHGTDVTLVGTQPSFKAITRFSILRSQATRPCRGSSSASRYATSTFPHTESRSSPTSSTPTPFGRRSTPTAGRSSRPRVRRS